MDAERLVKISRDSIPARKSSPRRPKEDGATKSQIKIGRIAYNKEEKEED